MTAVADVIYNPGRTNLLLQAEDLNRRNPSPGGELAPRSIRCAGGLPMLVHQAKRAEELFFDRPIPDGETERITVRLWR